MPANKTTLIAMNELQEIRQAFAVEGEELLTEVEKSLLRLEAHPDNADEFNRLFRAVHTLKGSAGIVGLFSGAVLP